MSPSRSFPSGPPPRASGLRWIAGRHLARRTGHAPVGHEGDAETTILKDTELRRQLVEFGHSVGFRSLEPHYYHDVPLQFTRLEGGHDVVLIVEHPSRSLHRPARRVDGAGLESGTAEIALHQPHPAIRLEGVGGAAQDALVMRSRRRVLEH